MYPLQLVFRETYSTSYASIHLTETIKEALDQDKYGCVDLQTSFDTVFDKSFDHKILLGKLKHYGIRGAACRPWDWGQIGIRLE